MMGRKGPAKALPAHAHPLVRRIYKDMELGGWTYEEMEKVSGVSACTVRKWAKERAPRLDNVEAVLNALGLRLTVQSA